MDAYKKEQIEIMLTRGVSAIYPSKKEVFEMFSQNKKLTIYAGFDPTGPTLHLGHAISLLKLKDLQDLGHKVIFLVGDFTAMIGDPTDKSATRQKLTKKEILHNLKEYKKQASKIIHFSGKNSAEIKFNAKWLGKMNFHDVLELASMMTVGQMIERDMFQKRIEEGKPIFLHEFLYPLMQGYDSVAMKVDGEVGGNDQIFNMLVGRDLVKSILKKEKFVIANSLLTDSSGKKMGKTEGNMLALSYTPENMFGKVMSWSDDMIVKGFELCTRIPLLEIDSIKKGLEENTLHPKHAKVQLALTIVTMFYGEKKALEAHNLWEETFSKGSIPENVETIICKANEKLIDIFSENNIVSSKGEFRRLTETGSITHMDSNEKINNESLSISGTYKIGKKRFVKIKN
jgi:tyrosyl-tRNA synthetase